MRDGFPEMGSDATRVPTRRQREPGRLLGRRPRAGSWELRAGPTVDLAVGSRAASVSSLQVCEHQ